MNKRDVALLMLLNKAKGETLQGMAHWDYESKKTDEELKSVGLTREVVAQQLELHTKQALQFDTVIEAFKEAK
jgi:hypothetical protein